MFKKNKNIEKYIEISNKVKIPGEKVIDLKERRKKKMNKKAIISAAMVAIVAGGVLFTNIGNGLKVSSVIEPIKVYASEGNREKFVEFEKGKKVEIKKQFAEVSVTEEDGNVSKIENSGIILDVISKDMVGIRLKANKGNFSADYGELGVKEVEGEKKLESDGKIIYKDEEPSNKDSKEFIKAQKEEISKNGQVEFDNLEGQVKEIKYIFADDVLKNKDMKTFGKVEIEIEAIYKDGKKVNQKLILTMDKDRNIFGELA